MAQKYNTQFADQLPVLSTEEKAALCSSIKAEGVRDPVIVDGEGNVLDGRHRLEIDPNAPTRKPPAWVQTDAEKKAFVFQVNLARRNINPEYKHALMKVMKGVAAELKAEGKTQEQIGVMLGSAQQTVSDWLKTEKNGNGMHNTGSGKRHNALPDARTKVTSAAKPVIAERLESGETQEQLAVDYGVHQSQISRIAKAEKQRQEEAAERKQRIEAAKKLDTLGIITGDFREKGAVIEDGSVDLIFTDPPYDRETLPQYADLAEFGARVLKPGGSLICYLGQYNLPQVLELMQPHLTFWWPLACLHTGKTARMVQWGVYVGWKPMLWFVNGTKRATKTFVSDLVKSEEDKDGATRHEWGQSEVEAAYYIEHLTEKGGLVVDPYCGGGTTCVAAKKAGRGYVAFEIDKGAAMLSRSRIAESAGE